MMWSSAYCFKVTVHQILAELCPFETFVNSFGFQLTSLTIYSKSSDLYRSQYMLLLATGYDASAYEALVV